MKPAQVIILLAQTGIRPMRLNYPTNGEDNEIWLTDKTVVYVSQAGNYAAVATKTASGERMLKPRSMILKSGRRALVEDVRNVIADELENMTYE
jgi:hypothetical protein